MMMNAEHEAIAQTLAFSRGAVRSEGERTMVNMTILNMADALERVSPDFDRDGFIAIANPR